MKRIGRKIELNAINIFLLVSISGIVLFFLIAPFLRQRSLEWLVMENNPHYIVLDFQLAELWGQHFGNAYEKSEIIYPPMALLAFKYISRITTSFDLSCDKCDVIHYPYQLMVLLLYVSLPVIWLYRCFQNTGLNRSKLSQLMFCIVCSVPMFAGFSFHEITLPPANLLPPSATYTVAPSANLSVLSLFVFVNAETSGSADSRSERSMVEPSIIVQPWK